jgi:hypothetical protein
VFVGRVETAWAIGPGEVGWEVGPREVVIEATGEGLGVDELSTLSKIRLKYAVTALVAGAQVDVTVDAVYFAFLPPGAIPVSGDWVAGDWETVSGTPPIYKARIMIGPGAKALVAGKYEVWLKIIDSPEAPVLPGIDFLVMR